MKILIFSQSGNETLMCDGICIGERKPKMVIGDELREVLEKKNTSTDTLIKEFGNSYVDTIKRVLLNQEIPKPKFVEKLCKILELPHDYFEDKELKNVLITDRGIVVATFPDNDMAIEVKKNLDKEIEEKYLKGIPIVINFNEVREKE